MRPFRKVYISAMILCFFSTVSAQEVTKDSITDNNFKGFITEVTDGMVGTVRETGRTIRRMGKEFNDIDTTFISPNLYNFAFMLQHTSSYEEYRFGTYSKNRGQSLTFAPDVSYKLGVYFGWRWIFLGYTFDVGELFGGSKQKISKKEYTLSLYSSKFGVDMYYRETGNGSKIRSARGFSNGNSVEDVDFNGIRSDIKGVNAYWIFNYKHFSYPSVYSQSTNQRRSCGSLMAGFSYSQHKVSFDYTQLPTVLQNDLDDALKFDQVKYSDYSINIGYGYNWVIKKNFVANLSLLPAIGYKKSRIIGSLASSNHWIQDINFDLITRSGVVYNNAKYFVGLSLLIHTYNYKKPSFSITNSFGSLNFYMGFNFWKKQAYKSKMDKKNK